MESLASALACAARHLALWRKSAAVLAPLIFLLLACPLQAQVGNNNPAGQSGIFNG